MNAEVLLEAPPVPLPEPAPKLPWRAFPVSQVLRSATLCALVLFSVTLWAQTAWPMRWVDDFIRSNQMAKHDRHLLLAWLVSVAALGAIGPAVYVLRKRTEAAVERLRALSHLISPLVVLGATPALFRWRPWTQEPLWLAATVLLCVVVLERTTRMAQDALPERIRAWCKQKKQRFAQRFPRFGKITPPVLLGIGVLFYAVFMSAMSLRFHYRLETRAFDLGGYDNLFYNMLKGHPFRNPAIYNTAVDWEGLKGHAELSIFALLPLYAIAPGATNLLILQSSLIALGAVPVYLMARRRLGNWTALILAYAFLLYPPAHSANLFDFHMQPVASFFVLWTAYFFMSRRNILFGIALALALGCREDISVGLTVAALFSLFVGFRPLASSITAAISVAYFVIIRFVVMPRFGQWWFQDIYKDLFPPGENSYVGVAKTMLSNPVYVIGTFLTEQKLIHMLQVLLPVAYLPLRRSYLWVLLIPGAFFTILTTGYAPTVATTFQYVGHWLPYIFIASIIGLEVIGKDNGPRARRAAVFGLVFGTLACTYNWGAMIQRNHFSSGWGAINLKPLTESEHQQLDDLRFLIAKIPPGASVAASEQEQPHLSNRTHVYTLRYTHGDADYILYRLASGKLGAENAEKLLAEGKYRRVATKGRFALIEKVTKQ